MPVTDEQEATLHAQLAGNTSEHARLLGQLDPAAARTGYSVLVSAAFFLAADQRFPPGTPAAAVTAYVADVRARTERTASLDPRTAERLLLAVSTDEELAGINPSDAFRTQLVLLAALVAGARPDPAALMTRARRLANRHLT